LLCKQDVRRSIAFSTVQISMPGTSCARSSAGIVVRSKNAGAATKILNLIKSSREDSDSHQIDRVHEGRDITLIPHSGVVICSGD
jgi:hypothetical protein